MYGMARDKALPEGLSKVSPKFRTPALAVLITMILTTIPLFLGDISIIANATVFGVLITFFLVNLSLIVLRKKKPELERPFKQKPNVSWIPIVALLGCIVCISLLFTFNLLIVIIQVIIILCGVVVFYAMKSSDIDKIILFLKKNKFRGSFVLQQYQYSEGVGEENKIKFQKPEHFTLLNILKPYNNMDLTFQIYLRDNVVGYSKIDKLYEYLDS